MPRLTDAIYGCKDTCGDDKLFDWEREWLAADLPPPPAKILLGGAGSGREVLSLSAQGYEILAFDPVLRFVKNARLSIGCQPGVEFVQGSYEDIVFQRNPAGPEVTHRNQALRPLRCCGPWLVQLHTHHRYSNTRATPQTAIPVMPERPGSPQLLDA